MLLDDGFFYSISWTPKRFALRFNIEGGRRILTKTKLFVIMDSMDISTGLNVICEKSSRTGKIR